MEHVIIKTNAIVSLLILVGVFLGSAVGIYLLAQFAWAIAKGLGKVGTFIIPFICGTVCAFLWLGEHSGFDAFFLRIITSVIVLVGALWTVSCMLCANLSDLDRKCSALQKEKQENRNEPSLSPAMQEKKRP